MSSFGIIMARVRMRNMVQLVLENCSCLELYSYSVSPSLKLHS